MKRVASLMLLALTSLPLFARAEPAEEMRRPVKVNKCNALVTEAMSAVMKSGIAAERSRLDPSGESATGFASADRESTIAVDKLRRCLWE